jgi:hypothetical protein
MYYRISVNVHVQVTVHTDVYARSTEFTGIFSRHFYILFFYSLTSCCHRRNFGTLRFFSLLFFIFAWWPPLLFLVRFCYYFRTLTPEFNSFVRQQFATSPEDINALLLGGVPPSLHGAIHFTGNGRLFLSWRQAHPHIAFFVVHVSHSRNVLLREMGLAPSRITRMGRRPDRTGHG